MKPAPTLLRLVAGRILLFALAAMILQIGIVLLDYWNNPEELGRRLIETQTESLAADLSVVNGRLIFAPSAETARRFPSAPQQEDKEDSESKEQDPVGDGYFARIRTPDGTVLFSNCQEECAEHFLPLDLNLPDFWQRTIRPGLPLMLTGGQTINVSGRTVAVEFATSGDPEGLVWRVLRHELFDHMLVPMSLMLVLVIGATILSIRNALTKVSLAAEAADRMDPRKAPQPLLTEGMPREIARLAHATNRALTRAAELVRSQKLFASAIAHEIRTPVSIVRMELERIDHERARKALLDLDSLTHTLEQLTALARLEAAEDEAFVETDIGTFAHDVVSHMAPLVFAKGKSISFMNQGGDRARMIPALIETLIRNLIENAVKHTPPGTAIVVATGPGATLSVSDNGGAAWPKTASQIELNGGIARPGDGVGIGLTIVQKIVDIHHGLMSIDRGTSAGSSVRIVLPDNHGPWIDLPPKRPVVHPE